LLFEAKASRRWRGDLLPSGVTQAPDEPRTWPGGIYRPAGVVSACCASSGWTPNVASRPPQHYHLKQKATRRWPFTLCGGAGGIWTPVRKTYVFSTTCLSIRLV